MKCSTCIFADINEAGLVNGCNTNYPQIFNENENEYVPLEQPCSNFIFYKEDEKKYWIQEII